MDVVIWWRMKLDLVEDDGRCELVEDGIRFGGG